VPELPEVETVANGVDARVRGQRIEEVWTSGKAQTFKSAESEIGEVLTGARIERVRRVGKTIVMTLGRRQGVEDAGGRDDGGKERANGIAREADSSAALRNDDQEGKAQGENGSVVAPTRISAEFLVHLGMTGRLLVSAAEAPAPAHTHAVLRLGDGREVRFVDPRRFGRLSVRVIEAVEDGYAGPGMEPLTISEEAFRGLFRDKKGGRRTVAIKAALLNQSLLHGVGNIYADEALARAGVRPRRQAGRLTRAEYGRLHAALKEVLTRAIELGGSSVSDYVDADGVRGFFQLEHRVYGRGGEPCRVCGTEIRKIVVGGRGTHFCPRCQH